MDGWKDSNRRETLPPNWSKIRAKVFERDGYQCVAIDSVTDERCKRSAEECDHIGSSLNHDLSNLRSLCHWHHAKRTALQAARAKRKHRDEIHNRLRRVDDHPGYL